MRSWHGCNQDVSIEYLLRRAVRWPCGPASGREAGRCGADQARQHPKGRRRCWLSARPSGPWLSTGGRLTAGEECDGMRYRRIWRPLGASCAVPDGPHRGNEEQHVEPPLSIQRGGRQGRRASRVVHNARPSGNAREVESCELSSSPRRSTSLPAMQRRVFVIGRSTPSIARHLRDKKRFETRGISEIAR